MQNTFVVDSESLLEWIITVSEAFFLKSWLFIVSLLAGHRLQLRSFWKFTFPALLSCDMIFLNNFI